MKRWCLQVDELVIHGLHEQVLYVVCDVLGEGVRAVSEDRLPPPVEQHLLEVPAHVVCVAVVVEQHVVGSEVLLGRRTPRLQKSGLKVK